MPPPLAPIITGGAGLISAGINWAAQNDANRQARDFQWNMYNRQRMDALLDWNMQNWYNSPQSQMRRLKAAGLNPNLVYGSGSVGNSAQGVRSSGTGSYSPRAPQVDLGGVAMQAYQSKYMDVQRQNLEKNWELMEERKRLMQAQAIKTLSDVDKNKLGIARGEFDLAQRQSLANYVMEHAKLKNDLLGTQITKTGVDIEYTLDANQRAWVMLGQNLKESTERILTLQKNRQVADKSMQMTDSQIQEVQHRIINMEKDGTLKQMEIEMQKLGLSQKDPAWWRLMGRIVTTDDGFYQDVLKNGVPAALKNLFGPEGRRQGYKEATDSSGKLINPFKQ